jgi:predicted ATPase
VNPSLQQFLEAARHLADAARFDAIQLGVVATDETPAVVLALSATLTRRESRPPPLPFLRTAKILAFQTLLPLEDLEALLTQLDEGVLEEMGRSVFTPALRLTGRGRSSALSWFFGRSARDGSGRSSKTVAASSELPLFAESMGGDVDEQIALGSNYAYSSLTRLIKGYTGLLIESHKDPNTGAVKWGPTFIALIAPWPVQTMTALGQGARVRVEVDGLLGLETGRFIVNVEGRRQDRRLDGPGLRWQATPPPDPSNLATYTTAFDAGDIEPTAVNLYVSGAPEVMLKTELQQEVPPPAKSPLEGWAFVTTRLSPTVRYETPEGVQLSRLRVGSFRLLRSVELDFEHPFVVLVGPNQSGKSSILDALQLLSDAARGELSEALVRRRSGLTSLLTRGSGSGSVLLEAELQAARGPNMRYRLELAPVGAYDFAVTEDLAQQVEGAWVRVLSRSGGQSMLAGTPVRVVNEREAILSQLGGIAHPLVDAIRSSLAAIAVYPYFRTGASWADPEAVPMRRPVRLEPGARLDRSGNNLAAALSSLRDERPADWEEFLGIVRLTFPNLKDLRIPAVTRGTVQLFWDEHSGQSFDAAELSDGTLSFLAILCALFQPGSALIAVDEPEQHLHPDALRRLVGAARSLSIRQPILFTTQSDTLIGLLDDAPESVAISSREPDGTARLIRPDVVQLQEWLKSFSLREMRRELEGWGRQS